MTTRGARGDAGADDLGAEGGHLRERLCDGVVLRDVRQEITDEDKADLFAK
jgi:hypothetical protein